MHRLREIPYQILARTVIQPPVLVALIQCVTMPNVVEVTTESEEDIVINIIAWQSSMKKERKGRISEKRTNFVVIVDLHVHAVSVFGKKIRCNLQFFGVFLFSFVVFEPPLPPSCCLVPPCKTKGCSFSAVLHSHFGLPFLLFPITGVLFI